MHLQRKKKEKDVCLAAVNIDTCISDYAFDLVGNREGRGVNNIANLN